MFHPQTLHLVVKDKILGDYFLFLITAGYILEPGRLNSTQFPLSLPLTSYVKPPAETLKGPGSTFDCLYSFFYALVTRNF